MKPDPLQFLPAVGGRQAINELASASRAQNRGLSGG